MPTILLTAFEPFAGADCNPSARVVDSLRSTTIPDVRLVTAILPVVAAEIPRRLDILFEQHGPDAFVGLGEARGAQRIRVEHRAVNQLQFSCDNSGAASAARPVFADGPSHYLSTLNVDALIHEIERLGTPVERSESCGTFCCNQVFYHARRHADLYRPHMIAGFIHLPSLPEQRVSGAAVPHHMALETQLTAVRAALRVVGHHVGLSTVNGGVHRPV